MRIVFMGTPDFAVPCLRQLLEDGYDIVGVFTQSDKPKGRHYTLTPPPVKELALEQGLPVYQPASLRDGAVLELLQTLAPELIVVVAYGKILPKEILELPLHGCINMHASLLPKLRGAAPIQWAILNGEKVTGVTSMQMDAGIDTGDMLLQQKTDILPEETAAELYERLSFLGAKVLHDTLILLKNGTISREKQCEEESCCAPMLSKELSPINWQESAEAVHNKIRGLSGWPATSTQIGSKTVKIHTARLVEEALEAPVTAGTFLQRGNRLFAACGDGKWLEILQLQPEGKKSMSAVQYLAGNPIQQNTTEQ